MAMKHKSHGMGHHKHSPGPTHVKKAPIKQASVGGSNLKLPNPSQTMQVGQKKDNLAGNVGGSSAHMLPDKRALPKQQIKLSGFGKDKKGSY